MAFGNLTVDFKQLSRIPVRDRMALAQSPQASQIFGNLTPSQIAGLFPDYYKRALNPMAGQVSSFAAALSGAAAVGTGSTSGGGGSTSATPASSSTTPAGSTRPGFIQEIVGDIQTPSPNKGKFTPKKDAGAIQKGIINLANKFGMNPIDVATFIRYETAGSMDPYKKGPKTQWGTHRGLIQMGDVQQAEYGINLDPSKGPVSSVEEQFVAIEKYFAGNGFFKWLADNPNATIHQKRLAMYATVNAGSPFKVKATDAHNGGAPGTVIDKVNDMYRQNGASHYNLAKEFMSASYDVEEISTAIPGTSPQTGQAPQGSDVTIENLIGTPADASVKVVPAPQGPAKTMLLSLGTNDFSDPKNTYQNTLDAINEGRKKGYNVVVVPPVSGSDKFKAAYDEVMRAVNETGAPVEQPQSYSSDGYHPTGEEYRRIGEKYQGAVVVGDSIAVGIGQYVDNGQTVATEGIRTDAILSRLKSEEIAKLDTAQIVPQTQNFDPALFAQIDPRLKQYWDTAPDGEKRAIEVAIMQKGVASINETMAKYPQASATVATSQTLEDAGYIITDKLGNITPQPRKWDPSIDDPGDSIKGEFNYSLTSEGAQSFGIADSSGRVSQQLVEKNLVTIQTNGGATFKVNKNIAGRATEFLNQLETRGYPIGKGSYAYSYRNKNGGAGSGLSTHATGTTIDLNPDSNWGSMRDGKGNIDMPPDIEKLANMHGFSWGAKFGDPMHFETMSPEVYQEKLKILENEGYIKRKETQVEAQKAQLQQLEQQTAQVVQPEPGQPLPGAESQTATPPKDPTTGGDVPIEDMKKSTADAVPAKKLGGTEEIKEPNSVKESMSLVADGKEVAKFNKNEEVNVADGKINVQNEYQKKTNETQQKTDKGSPQQQQQNTGSMRGVPAQSTDVLRRIPEGYSPISPSAMRAFANIKSDRHWEKGLVS